MAETLAQTNQQLQALQQQRARLQVATQATPAQAPQKVTEAAAFKLTAQYRKQGQGEFIPLTEGAALHSGNTYKFIVSSNVTRQVYLFQQDSHGQIVRLFPMAEFAGRKLKHANPMQANQTYFLPAEDFSFELDRNTGVETVYLKTANEPDILLESFQNALSTAQSANDAATHAALGRGLSHVLAYQAKGMVTHALAADQAKPVQWQEGGTAFSAQPRQITDFCSDCTLMLRFRHE